MNESDYYYNQYKERKEEEIIEKSEDIPVFNSLADKYNKELNKEEDSNG